MDFIERIFGISPDNGSGAFELLLFTILICGLYVIVKARLRRRHRSREQQSKIQ
jgi:hypothetical protein